MTRHGAWQRVTLLVFALSLVIPATALATSPTRLRDISRTASGAQEARAAAARYSASGVRVTAGELQVLQSADGDTFVLPVGVQPALGGPSGDDVIGVLVGGRSWASSEPLGKMETQASSDWPIRSSNCFTRKSKTYGYMDACYQLRWHDGGSTNDYFALHAFGTVWVTSGHQVNSAYVQSKPAGGSSTKWVEWDPGGTVNPSGACDSVTLGIGTPVSLTFSHSVCDTWNIAKGTTSGDFRTTWTRSGAFAAPQSRQVAFLLDMKGAENAYPVFLISWDFSGS